MIAAHGQHAPVFEELERKARVSGTVDQLPHAHGAVDAQAVEVAEDAAKRLDLTMQVPDDPEPGVRGRNRRRPLRAPREGGTWPLESGRCSTLGRVPAYRAKAGHACA